MRRKDKEIIDTKKISEIINTAKVCRLAMSDNNIPYIVPLSFGYDGTYIYFHSALKGKKMDILGANNRVCFEFERDIEIVRNEDNPCDWSCSFQTIIGFGRALELIALEDKIRGLQAIMAQYSDKKWDFTTVPLTGLRVWAIDIDSMTGKQSPA